MCFRRPICIFIIGVFLSSFTFPLNLVYANTIPHLPMPGMIVNLSTAYEPVMIKGLTIHKDNPFLFDFIVDIGQDKMTGVPLKQEGEKLIKYFLASLAIPDKDVWVNLSPYEKEKIIPDALGQTEMGRDLLAQDYLLKQITASLIYPEKQLGKKFWDKVYAKAQQQFGTTQIPVNTFNKVWIMADRAEVFEHNQTAFITESHLKVMLEEDYLAIIKNQSQPKVRQPGDMFQKEQQKVSPSTLPSKNPLNSKAPQGINQMPTQMPTRGHVQKEQQNVSSSTLPRALPMNAKAPQGNPASRNVSTFSLSSQIIKEIILPELEKEINTGKNFANLRQIFNSIILSSWYKNNLKQALLNQVYSNQSKVKGIERPEDLSPQHIYKQYLKAYKKGVFDYIKEDITQVTGEVIPRRYFSGGVLPGVASQHKVITLKNLAMGAQKISQQKVNGLVNISTFLTTTKTSSSPSSVILAMKTLASKEVAKVLKDLDKFKAKIEIGLQEWIYKKFKTLVNLEYSYGLRSLEYFNKGFNDIFISVLTKEKIKLKDAQQRLSSKSALYKLTFSDFSKIYIFNEGYQDDHTDDIVFNEAMTASPIRTTISKLTYLETKKRYSKNVSLVEPNLFFSDVYSWPSTYPHNTYFDQYKEEVDYELATQVYRHLSKKPILSNMPFLHDFLNVKRAKESNPIQSLIDFVDKTQGLNSHAFFYKLFNDVESEIQRMESVESNEKRQKQLNSDIKDALYQWQALLWRIVAFWDAPEQSILNETKPTTLPFGTVVDEIPLSNHPHRMEGRNSLYNVVTPQLRLYDGFAYNHKSPPGYYLTVMYQRTGTDVRKDNPVGPVISLGTDQKKAKDLFDTLNKGLEARLESKERREIDSYKWYKIDIQWLKNEIARLTLEQISTYEDIKISRELRNSTFQDYQILAHRKDPFGIITEEVLSENFKDYEKIKLLISQSLELLVSVKLAEKIAEDQWVLRYFLDPLISLKVLGLNSAMTAKFIQESLLRNPEILIIEDQKIWLGVYKKIMEESGYEQNYKFHYAVDMQEALHFIKERGDKLGLVITDGRFPLSKNADNQIILKELGLVRWENNMIAGVLLSNKLSQKFPDLPVLIASSTNINLELPQQTMDIGKSYIFEFLLNEIFISKSMISKTQTNDPNTSLRHIWAQSSSTVGWFELGAESLGIRLTNYYLRIDFKNYSFEQLDNELSKLLIDIKEHQSKLKQLKPSQIFDFIKNIKTSKDLLQKMQQSHQKTKEFLKELKKFLQVESNTGINHSFVSTIGVTTGHKYHQENADEHHKNVELAQRLEAILWRTSQLDTLTPAETLHENLLKTIKEEEDKENPKDTTMKARSLKLPLKMETKTNSASKAMTHAPLVDVTRGGIDLNTTHGMTWKVSKDGNGVEMNVDPAMILRIKQEGIYWLSPVILHMIPVPSIWPLLGLNPPQGYENQIAKVL